MARFEKLLGNSVKTSHRATVAAAMQLWIVAPDTPASDRMMVSLIRSLGYSREKSEEIFATFCAAVKSPSAAS
jgi:hypothetical protein